MPVLPSYRKVCLQVCLAMCDLLYAEVYSELFQTSKKEHFLKIFSFFTERLQLRCLTGFYIHLLKIFGNYLDCLSLSFLLVGIFK